MAAESHSRHVCCVTQPPGKVAGLMISFLRRLGSWLLLRAQAAQTFHCTWQSDASDESQLIFVDTIQQMIGVPFQNVTTLCLCMGHPSDTCGKAAENRKEMQNLVPEKTIEGQPERLSSTHEGDDVWSKPVRAHLQHFEGLGNTIIYNCDYHNFATHPTIMAPV